MLINPYGDGPSIFQVIAGTRVLQNQFGLQNAVVQDPKRPERLWRVHVVYAPIPGRKIGGMRIKLIDAKGFITFCNQRDFELLIELARPNDWCPWMEQPYPGVNDTVEGGVGLCMDEEDLIDDIYERELLLRAQQSWGILSPTEITRRLHLEAVADVEQVDVFMWDADPTTGLGPDPRFETVGCRWRRSERRSVKWA